DRYGVDAIFEAVVADVRVERGKGGRKGLERHDARLGPKARGPDAEDAHVGAAVEDRLARLRQDIAAANKDLPEDFHFLGSRQRERSAAAQGYAKRVRAAHLQVALDQLADGRCVSPGDEQFGGAADVSQNSKRLDHMSGGPDAND